MLAANGVELILIPHSAAETRKPPMYQATFAEDYAQVHGWHRNNVVMDLWDWFSCLTPRQRVAMSAIEDPVWVCFFLKFYKKEKKSEKRVTSRPTSPTSEPPKQEPRHFRLHDIDGLRKCYDRVRKRAKRNSDLAKDTERSKGTESPMRRASDAESRDGDGQDDDVAKPFVKQVLSDAVNNVPLV